MAAALTDRPAHTLLSVPMPTRAPSPPPVVAGLAIGRDMGAVLRAVLATSDGEALRRAGEPDGLVIAVRGEDVDVDAAALVPDALEGRPTAVVVVGSCPHASAEVLAGMRQAVVDAGGLPVGAGMWVDPIDARSGADGQLVDLTVHATLALLGSRTQRLAWSRRVLRRD